MARRPVVARTPDGLTFEIQVDDDNSLYHSASAGRGELVRVDQGVGRTISRLATEVSRALQATRSREDPEARSTSGATVEFGLKLDAEAGFVISRGREDASIVITLQFKIEDQ